MPTLTATPPQTCTRKPGATDTKCRCSDTCKDLARRANSARKLSRAQGNGNNYVDATTVAAHISTLLSATPGSSIHDLATISGVTRRTINTLLNPATRRATVYSATASKLLAVTHLPQRTPPATLAAPPGRPARRMVEALMAQGFPLTLIAQASGLSATTLSAHNAEHLSADARARITRAYKQLRFRPGSCDRTRDWARGRGYAPWSVWSPNIADPDAVLEVKIVADVQWRAAIQQRLDDKTYPLA